MIDGINVHLFFLKLIMTNTTEETCGRILLSGCTRSINFPLWVLIQDGLHAPPFDKHRSRYGILQQHSMNAVSWHEWFRLTLIRCDNRLANNKYIPEYKNLDIDFIRDSTPTQLWNGNAKVKEILEVMWNDFKSVKANQYVDELLTLPEHWDKDLHSRGFRQVHICDYPHEIEVFIPPIFHIITAENEPIDIERIKQRISRSLRD